MVPKQARASQKVKLQRYASLLGAVSFALPLSAPAAAGADGMTGNWITQDHSVVQIYSCGGDMLCAKLIRTVLPNSIDDLNPDPLLKNRPICGVQLGKDFAVIDPSHAKAGKFYDPNVGKTYTADITLTGETLKVRGYIGVSLFGRTETWHRTNEAIKPCAS